LLGIIVVALLETQGPLAQRLSYALLTATLCDNRLTTMAVRDLGPHQAEVAWSASFHKPTGSQGARLWRC